MPRSRRFEPSTPPGRSVMSFSTACTSTARAFTAAAPWPSPAARGGGGRRDRVGTAQTIFDVTLDYAKQREQFGVPIGSFQAIKHKFADMIDLARARPRHSATSPRSRSPRTTRAARAATSVAKAAAGDCQRLARQRRHPDPRRHRLHVGARHAPLREAHEVGRAALRHEQRHRARIADLLGV